MAKEKVFVLEVNEQNYKIAQDRLVKAADILTDRYAQWLGLGLPKLADINDVFTQVVNKESNLIEDDIRAILLQKVQVPAGLSKTMFSSMLELPEGAGDFLKDSPSIKNRLNSLIKGNGITAYLTLKGDKIVLNAAGKASLKEKHSIVVKCKDHADCYNEIKAIVGQINEHAVKYGKRAFELGVNINKVTGEYSVNTHKFAANANSTGI